MFDQAQVVVRPVVQIDERRFQHLMQKHHYLGALPKISETIWYVASFGDTWVALLSFSAAALIGIYRTWLPVFYHCAKKENSPKMVLVKPLTPYTQRLLSQPCPNPAYRIRGTKRKNQMYAQKDESLAIDGKTMCNAIDDQGHQTHILSAIGHQSKICYTPNLFTEGVESREYLHYPRC